MKKILLSALLALPVLALGQSQRLVLLEHFTQASCGPCATLNPGINRILENRESDVVAIKYQVNWPGVDPMNADNPTEVLDRRTFYQVNSVPNSALDGKKPGSE